MVCFVLCFFPTTIDERGAAGCCSVVGRPGLGSGQLSQGELGGRRPGRTGEEARCALESLSRKSGWEVGFENRTESPLGVKPLSPG